MDNYKYDEQDDRDMKFIEQDYPESNINNPKDMDLTEIVEELLKIKDQLSEITRRLDSIGRSFGYDSRVYNIMNGYVTPYLEGITGKERTIMMNLQDVIDEVEELSFEQEEFIDDFEQLHQIVEEDEDDYEY